MPPDERQTTEGLAARTNIASVTLMDDHPETPPRKFPFLLILAFVAIALLGCFLRIYPSEKYTKIGFDEGLYGEYVVELVKHGITSYPDLAEFYVRRQQELATVILPPTRFLYIFCAYLWQEATGANPIASLRGVSCLFSILLMFAAAGFAWRLGGRGSALAVFALMSCAPTQIHMAQHGLIDGFFAFWATVCLWLLWENLKRPNDLLRLSLFGVCLALLVVTKENAFFAYTGLLALLGLNKWLRFGTVTRSLLLVTVAGPLAGAVLLVTLCGGAQTCYQIYQLVISKASVSPYSIATGDGPWYRYLLDLLVASPLIFLLTWGAIFRLKLENKAVLYLLGFVTATYVVMCNVRYGMNLRYTNMWDMPMRFLALTCVSDCLRSFRRRELLITIGVALLCAYDLRQYQILFVDYGLYELVPGGLLRALHILKDAAASVP
jgi:4-amino-4-deoxy-L-arabinose transferase-like glycosyltransferase